MEQDVFIDVNKERMKHAWCLARFERDPLVSARNRDLVAQFLRDARLGKTNPLRARKIVGMSRLTAFMQHLGVVIRYLQKDLDQVS